MVSNQVLKLSVVSKDTSCEGIAQLVLEDHTGAVLPAWTPGAHIGLRLPDGTARQYSLCSDPAIPETWMICVRYDPEGRGGSSYVYNELGVGDVVEVSEPLNHFELEEAIGYMFVVGGIGITPIKPMIEHAERNGLPWKLAYLGRYRSSMMFVDDLLHTYPDKVSVFAKDEGTRPPIAVLLAALPDQHLVYACGPAGMLDAVVEATRESGRANRLFLERFAPSVPAELPSDTEFDVKCALTKVTVPVPAGTSILEAVRDVGIMVSFSCSEGSCGTCETTVISGDVDHRDVVLTQDEKNESATMMICVSRATCPTLVLEL